MAKSNGRLPAPEVTADSIKVAVSADEFIVFGAADWTMEAPLLFQSASYADAIALIVEHSDDWHIKDANGALIQFKKADLLDRLTRIRNMEREPDGSAVAFPRIPMQTYRAMSSAFWVAVRESQDLPLEKKLPSTN
jgi:hypothetical protein